MTISDRENYDEPRLMNRGLPGFPRTKIRQRLTFLHDHHDHDIFRWCVPHIFQLPKVFSVPGLPRQWFQLKGAEAMGRREPRMVRVRIPGLLMRFLVRNWLFNHQKIVIQWNSRVISMEFQGDFSGIPGWFHGISWLEGW